MDPDARRRLPLPDAWLRPSRRASRWRRIARSVVLGWLVVMTIWGFGRSGFPQHHELFLAVGVVAGLITAVVSGRHASRR